MRYKWPILTDKLALQTGFVALLVYTTLLCFQPIFPPITFAISLYWLFYVLSFRKSRLARILSNPLAILWIGYYAIVLIGLTYSNHTTEGWKDVLLKITLFLWPLAFSSWPEVVYKYKIRVLQIFGWTLAISALLVVIIGIWRWQVADVKLHQLYGYLNIWPMIPNHYMALYSSFGIFVFVHCYRKCYQNLLYTILGILPFIALLLVTSVRIQMLALPVAVIVFIIFDIHSSALRKRVLGGSLLGIVLLIALAFLVPSTRNRINNTVDELRSINGMVDNKQTNHRVFIWRYGSEVVSENLYFGTGTGSADFALHEKLKHCDAKFWNGHAVYYLRDRLYNYHNALLQHFAAHGIVMFLLLFGLFVYPFIRYRKKITGIDAAFLSLCFISFLTESMLERQAGVLFFGFFYNFLFTTKELEETSTAEK